MNKHYTLQNDDGKRFFCIIADGEQAGDQWNEVFAIHPGCGFSVDVWDTEVRIVDYFHGETRASFAILAAEPTDEPVSTALTPL